MARRGTSVPRGLRPLLGREQIARRMPDLAREVHAALRNSRRPLAVVVLQGAFIFAADLLRHFPAAFRIEVAFMRCQSYRARRRSSGRVLLLQDLGPDVNLRGRTVLLLDDILDTGLTMDFLIERLRARGAARVIPCVLLRRTGARLGQDAPGFAGFQVGKGFAVGYGLDLDGCYRHWPDLAALAPQAGRRRGVR